MMPAFGRRSRERLATLHPRLKGVLIAVMESATDARDDDFSVLTGRRGRAEQTEAVATGHSRAPWPESAHNCPIPGDGPKDEWPEDTGGLSRAADLAPWPIVWEDVGRFQHLAGRVMQQAAMMDVRLVWGGDFRSFKDWGHFELDE